MTRPLLMEYFIGLDLARARDFSAFAAISARQEPCGTFDAARFEQHYRTVLHVGSLKRIPLGTEYMQVVAQLRRLIQKLLLKVPFGWPKPTIHVVFDAAGPGHVVLELLRAANLDANLYPVVMTSGVELGRVNGRATIPRKNLVANLRYLLESELLQIQKGLEFTETLVREVVSVRPHGGQYPHDDLVIALSLAAWRATKLRSDLTKDPRAA